MGITSSSVYDTHDNLEREKLNQETSFARHMLERTGIHPATHWRQIASAAKYLNGLTASTADLNQVLTATSGSPSSGSILKIRHGPWRTIGTVGGTVSHHSGAIASSVRLRMVIASSYLTGTSSIWYISRSRFGLGRIIAAQVQICSTRSVWPVTDVRGRHPITLVAQLYGAQSTVVIRQYGVVGATPGSVYQSSGDANVQVFAYGY